MKPFLSLFVLTVLLLSACASLSQGDMTLVTQGGGPVVNTPIATDIPQSAVADVSSTWAAASSNATRQAEVSATSTALGFQVDLGTATVAAPRADGIDLGDISAWQRYTDSSGISFDYLSTSYLTPLEPRMDPPELGGNMLVSPDDSSVAMIGADSNFWVDVSMAGSPRTDDPAFPNNLGNPQGEANWLVDSGTESPVRTVLYVHGYRNQYPRPDSPEFWGAGGAGQNLTAILLVPKCNGTVTVYTPFGNPGPVADALEHSLDDVIAEHFPVFDHMYRSVQFPPECGAPAPPSPLETPSSP